MSKHPLHEVVDALLTESGGLYTFADILEELKTGEMQSFTINESWAVTKIGVFPRKRVLDIVLLVGTIDDEDDLHAMVERFAREQGLHMMHTWARHGFKSHAERHGWKQQNMVLYTKDLSNGS